MLLGVAMSVYAQPPRILQIYRDHLKPGSSTVYRKIEEDAARVALDLGFPHPYLAVESLNGPKEVWFLNGWTSPADQKQVVDDYAKNAQLIAAFERIAKRKAALALEPVEAFANYRQDLSRGAPWSLGLGRFLVITVTQSERPIEGTVFESADGDFPTGGYAPRVAAGTQFLVTPAQTRGEANAKAAARGSDTIVFAVRPSWSLPAKEWVTSDPEFWKPNSPMPK